MTERDNRSEVSKKVSNLEKVGRIAIATTILASCKPGEQAPSLDEVNDTNARVEESQEVESGEQGEIKITQEAFTGSEIEGTQVVELESTQSLGLGVEKTNAIVEEIKEKGLNPEDASYLGINKKDEAGNSELVIIVSTPSAVEGENTYFYVSGRDKGNFVPVESSSQIELLEMREYEMEEDGNTVFGFETDEGELIPVIKFGKNIDSYIDPYTRVVTRMSEELSSEVMAMLSSMPEGTQELIDRLGEGAEIVDGNLVYNGTVIGELDNERQVSFQVEEEIISLSTENLEVKDGILVSINRERTEEMGVDWVEQVWIEGDWVELMWIEGERVAVPEPQVLLPETYEETLIVKEQVLDYFMLKLLAAEKKYLNENGWPGEEQNNGNIAFPQPEKNKGLPYVERDFNMGIIDNDEELFVVSWTRVQMGSGKMLDLMGVPFEPVKSNFGSLDGNYVWHFVYDNSARANWLTGWGIDSNVSMTKREYIFDAFNSGQKLLIARMFFDAREVEGWEEEYGWTEDRVVKHIGADGFEDIDILVRRISLNIPGYSEIMGKTMLASARGHSSEVAPDGFMEDMEKQAIPSLGIYGDFIYGVY